METDLLARICAELEQRMAELHPLLDEYERLLATADALAVTDTGVVADGSPTATSAPAPAAPAGPSRGPRGSAAATIERAVSASDGAAQAPAPPPVEARVPVMHEPDGDEFEPEPERKRASPGEVRRAVLAALEHGSHTVSELVMVTAMSPSEIRANLSRLARQRKVTRVKRQGDGKSAYALPASSVHA